MRWPTVVLAVTVLAASACTSGDEDDAGAAGATPSGDVATTDVAPAGTSAETRGTPASAASLDSSTSVAPGTDAARPSGPATTARPTVAGGADDTVPRPAGTTGTPEEELEESLSELGVETGTGVVEIGGAEWTFEAEICDARRGFTATGPASGPGGRAGFAEIYVEASTDLDDDGEPDQSGSVSLAVGKTELFGEPEPGRPLWLALLQTFGGLDQRDFTYRIDGPTITGDGEIRNTRGATGAGGRSVPLSFEVSCG